MDDIPYSLLRDATQGAGNDTPSDSTEVCTIIIKFGYVDEFSNRSQSFRNPCLGFFYTLCSMEFSKVFHA